MLACLLSPNKFFIPHPLSFSDFLDLSRILPH
jgi:hypothetical protein